MDPSEHEKAMPIGADHLATIERAVDRTRASHAGQPFAAVHQAIGEALNDGGAQRVVRQVVEGWRARSLVQRLGQEDGGASV